MARKGGGVRYSYLGENLFSNSWDAPYAPFAPLINIDAAALQQFWILGFARWNSAQILFRVSFEINWYVWVII